MSENDDFPFSIEDICRSVVLNSKIMDYTDVAEGIKISPMEKAVRLSIVTMLSMAIEAKLVDKKTAEILTKLSKDIFLAQSELVKTEMQFNSKELPPNK